MRQVLVVDDNPEFVETLKILLEAGGYAVQTAQDGLEALEILNNPVGRKPEVVVADITMPRCNGLELCRQVRLLPGLELLPFIFLSARAEPQDRVAGLLLGADDYLTKPFETEELLLRIEKQVRWVQLGAARQSSAQAQASVAAPAQPDNLARLLLAPDSPIAQLSSTEREIFYWVTQGLTNRQIAEHLYLSIRTVQGHVASIRAKLHLSRREDILGFAHQQGLMQDHQDSFTAESDGWD